jgi:hypothetical protein
MCLQKGINRVRVNNYLDTQEGDQFVDQVVVNCVYRGDDEQLLRRWQQQQAGH